MKKFLALVLSLCMVFSLAAVASAAEIDANGGSGSTPVYLSSTADGSIGGDPAATKMSVTVPTVLPIAVGTDGTVSTATDAKIVNNSFGAVKVNSVSIEAAQGWSLAAWKWTQVGLDDTVCGSGYDTLHILQCQFSLDYSLTESSVGCLQRNRLTQIL